ncbi:uncharacterized protein LOC126670612 [Mercurialis annua]|uniref:uncharacterized protein LOC126670612 n=1 Tax=Mercurialis annua TaxID=3986 RepID=UPI00215F9F0A|nr:uncharacterized protein LOC126670612 [Mercurialis annua]
MKDAKTESDSSDNLEYFMAKADIEKLDLNHQHNKMNAASHCNVEPELSDISVHDAPFIGSRTPEFGDDELSGAPSQSHLSAEEGDDKNFQKVTSDNHQSSKIRNETQVSQSQEKALARKVIARTFELQQLEEEYNLLKAAADMAFSEAHPIDFYLEQLNRQVDSKRHNITELESEWDAFRKPLVEKKISLEESLYGDMPDAQEKLQKLREVELEKQSILSEVKRREEDYSKLCLELEKLSGLPSRISYIERIKEITKNSRKQDADIERILKETRELQLESNSIQDSLHRTYAVLDELVFREAKKEPVGRQAYRLLTSIHECFEQIAEKILVTDRIRREMADYEKKLTAMAARGLDVEKLQDDLDAIRKENEKLEQLKEN